MRSLLPGLLMLVESVVFVALEWRLRRRAGWRQGALDHATVGVVVGPLVVFLLAALVFSTAGWDLLRLPGVLTVLALPIALAAAFRAVRGDRQRLAADADDDADTAADEATPGRLRRAHPTLLAVGLSLGGLTVLAIGADG